MVYRSQGHARIDPSNPRAKAICDVCGFQYNLTALRWQHQWSGTHLVNTRILACPTCLDVPSEAYRTVFIPADPRPVMGALVEPYDQDESNWITTQALDVLVTEGGDQLITEA